MCFGKSEQDYRREKKIEREREKERKKGEPGDLAGRAHTVCGGANFLRWKFVIFRPVCDDDDGSANTGVGKKQAGVVWVRERKQERLQARWEMFMHEHASEKSASGFSGFAFNAQRVFVSFSCTLSARIWFRVP